MFAYYAKWLPNLSDRVKHLATVESFPLSREALPAFERLKVELENG